MNCKEVTELMDGYLDGELDPVTNQKIEDHLRECSRLRSDNQGAHSAGRWQLTQLLRIIRPRPLCGSGSNPLCEMEFPNPRTALPKYLPPGSPAGGKIRGYLFSRRLGPGWALPPPSFWPWSSRGI